MLVRVTYATAIPSADLHIHHVIQVELGIFCDHLDGA